MDADCAHADQQSYHACANCGCVHRTQRPQYGWSGHAATRVASPTLSFYSDHPRKPSFESPQTTRPVSPWSPTTTTTFSLRMPPKLPTPTPAEVAQWQQRMQQSRQQSLQEAYQIGYQTRQQNLPCNPICILRPGDPIEDDVRRQMAYNKGYSGARRHEAARQAFLAKMRGKV